MKKVISLFMLLVLVVTIVGCSKDKESKVSSNSTDPVTVTVWCWDPTFNVYAMQEAGKIYSASHSNVTIDVVETAWDDIQTKLTTAVTSGQKDILPDILLMQDNALAKNIINYPDTFLDLTNSGIDFSKFAAYKTALSSVNGKNYGVPFDSGAAITCLRTDILEQAGFTIEDFTDITWSDFLEKGKVVLEKTGKPMLSCQAGSPDLLMLMLQSAGTWLFNGDNTYISENEVLIEVVNTYTELVKSGVVIEVNDWDQYIASINNSTVAGTINGCWIIGSVSAKEEQSGLWEITNVPKLDKAANASNYSNQGGSSWLVTKDSKKSEVAVDFLKETFAGSVKLYETILPSAGALATYLPAGDSSVYGEAQPFFNNKPIYEMITEFASKVPQVSYGVYNYEARDAVGTAITRILSGTDMETALKEAEAEVNFQMGK